MNSIEIAVQLWDHNTLNMLWKHNWPKKKKKINYQKSTENSYLHSNFVPDSLWVNTNQDEAFKDEQHLGKTCYLAIVMDK